MNHEWIRSLSVVLRLGLSVVLLLACCGCDTNPAPGPGPYRTMAADPFHNIDAARRHNARALELIRENHWDEAEKELKDALTADRGFGPAHNNLGTVYYHQKRMYEAAIELDAAAKLMPNKAEPRNNLGLVLEDSGRTAEAIKSYEEAVSVEPAEIRAVANLARIYIRQNRKDSRTRQLLGEVVGKDTRHEWVAWAKEQLVRMGPSDATTEPAP